MLLRSLHLKVRRVQLYVHNSILLSSLELYMMGNIICPWQYLLIDFYVITAHKRSLRRLCFYRCLSVHTRETCVVLFRGDVHGFIWGGVCVVLFGGVHGFIQGGGTCGFIQEACMVLFGGLGMHGFILGACVVLFGVCVWFYLGGMHGFIWGAVWFYLGGHAWFFQFFRIQ